MNFQFNEFDEMDADFWDDEFRDDDYREPDFVAEMGAFERVGFGRADIEGIGIIGEGAGADDLRKAHKKIMRMDLSGPKKLQLLLDDYNRKYYDHQFWPITEEDMDKIYEYIPQLNEPGYKNPVAYMLGYYITNRDGKIDKKKFDDIVKKTLPNIERDIIIRPEDLVRYARLWATLR